MKTTRFLAAIGVACAIALSAMLPQAAVADDNNWPTPNGSRASGAVGMCLNAQNQAVPCSDPSALPSPVSGTFSATLAGFTPNNNFATLTATASTSGSTAMPAGAVVGFQNTSSVDVSCVLSAGAATATTNKIVVRAGATVFLTVGSNVNAACINQTGSAGSNLVVLEGGSGLGNDSGGGGGSGGGATNVTQVGGTNVNATIAAAGGMPVDALTGGHFDALFGQSVPLGGFRIGYTTDDPCSNASIKAFLPITLTTAAVKVIAPGVAAKKITICHIDLNNSAADSIAIFESTTGTTCATAAVAVYGAGTSVATAGNGYNFSANGGISLGNGKGTVGQTTVNNNDLCVAQSAATPLTGGIVYAVQ